MASLRELQRRFAAAVVGGGDHVIAACDCIADDAPGAAARLAVHAHHFRLTLIEALQSTFPVVNRLVGAPFFTTIARRYVLGAPPRRPCLFEYGDRFPAFLGAQPEARSLAYLADVARLEWALNRAAHAEDVPPLDSAAAARFVGRATGELIIGLDPACRLIASPWPIDRIWLAHQAQCGSIEPVDLDIGGALLLVCREIGQREAGEVGWLRLNAPAFGLVGSLLADGRLRKASALAAAIDPAFDAGPLLAVLIEGGAVLSINQTH